MPTPVVVDPTALWPTAHDSFTALNGTDVCEEIDLAGVINHHQNVLGALETALGLSGATGPTTLIGRVTDLEAGGSGVSGTGVALSLYENDLPTAVGGENVIGTAQDIYAYSLVRNRSGVSYFPPVSERTLATR